MSLEALLGEQKDSQLGWGKGLVRGTGEVRPLERQSGGKGWQGARALLSRRLTGSGLCTTKPSQAVWRGQTEEGDSEWAAVIVGTRGGEALN